MLACVQAAFARAVFVWSWSLDVVVCGSSSISDAKKPSCLRLHKQHFRTTLRNGRIILLALCRCDAGANRNDLMVFLSLILRNLQSVPLPLPLSRSSFVMHMKWQPG